MTPARAGSDIIAIEDARFVRGRPPSARLLLDVVLANPSGKARWALLPGQLPADEGGVFAVETLRVDGVEPVVLARILGRGGRVAVRLSPRSRVRLRGVGLEWWGPLPDRLVLTLELVPGVAIAGRPLESWLAADASPLADGTDATVTGALTLDSRFTDGLVSVPLELEGAVQAASTAWVVARPS